MKNKPYKFKLKRSGLAEGFKGVLRCFKHKPEIVNLSGGELPEKAIYLSNHTGAHGPLTYELFFPKRLTPWGTHEMCGNFKERWNYLYHIFYQQKLHWNKAKSFIVATLFAPISRMLYNGVGLIATYTDMRFVGTMKTSCRVLDKNSSIIIFPEDSSRGYLDPPPSFHSGFIYLAKMYKKLRGEDLPVYVCYCSAKQRKIVISQPMFINKMLDDGKSEDEVNATALASCQDLYYQHIAQPQKAKKNKKATKTSK